MRTDRVLLLAVSGAAAGAAIVLFDVDAPERSRAFVQLPEFVVWLFLMVAQTAFFAVVAAPLFVAIRELEAHLEGRKAEVTVSAVLFSLLFSVPPGVPRSIFLGEVPGNRRHPMPRPSAVTDGARPITPCCVVASPARVLCTLAKRQGIDVTMAAMQRSCAVTDDAHAITPRAVARRRWETTGSR